MQTHTRALLFVLGCSGLGVLLSGYLSYRNYFLSGCAEGPLSKIVTCGGPQAVHIFGQPTCIYGLIVFLAVFITTLIGLNRQPSRPLNLALVMMAIAGTLFSGYLSVYEIGVQRLGFSPVPACIFGLVFFSGALKASILAWRATARSTALLPAT